MITAWFMAGSLAEAAAQVGGSLEWGADDVADGWPFQVEELVELLGIAAEQDEVAEVGEAAVIALGARLRDALAGLGDGAVVDLGVRWEDEGFDWFEVAPAAGAALTRMRALARNARDAGLLLYAMVSP